MFTVARAVGISDGSPLNDVLNEMLNEIDWLAAENARLSSQKADLQSELHDRLLEIDDAKRDADMWQSACLRAEASVSKRAQAEIAALRAKLVAITAELAGVVRQADEAKDNEQRTRDIHGFG